MITKLKRLSAFLLAAAIIICGLPLSANAADEPLTAIKIKVVAPDGVQTTAVKFDLHDANYNYSPLEFDANGYMNYAVVADGSKLGKFEIAPTDYNVVTDPLTFTFEVTQGADSVVSITKVNDAEVVSDASGEYTITLSKVYKKAMTTALDNANNNYKEIEYTTASYQPLKDAISAASSLKDDPDATQSAVDTATANIAVAIAGLQKETYPSEVLISVLDKDGNLTTATDFECKKSQWDYVTPTWENNKLKIAAGDAYIYNNDEVTYIVQPKDTSVITNPLSVSITMQKVNSVVKITKINGVRATGEENLQIQILPEGSANKKALDAKLTEAKGYQDKKSDYTATSFKILTDAISETENVMDDLNATQDAVDAQVEKLTAAISQLESIYPKTLSIGVKDQKDELMKEGAPEFVVSYTSYTQAQNDALVANQDGSLIFTPSAYTGTTITNYEIKLKSDAKVKVTPEKITVEATMVNGTPFITKINEATVTGEENLEFKIVSAYKVDLEAAIDEANKKKVDDYTADSYQVLQTAVNDAKTLVNDIDATQADVDAQVTTINNAIQNLKTDTITTEKKLFIKIVNQYDQKMDTAPTFTYLNPQDSYPFAIDLTYNAETGYIRYTAINGDAIESDTEYQYEVCLKDNEDNKEYSITPEKITFTVKKQNGVTTIVAVNGQPLVAGEEFTFHVNDPKAVNPVVPEKKTVSKVELAKDKYTYNGKVQKPAVIAKNNKGETIPASDYTVSYSGNCKNVNSYNVKVTFKGDYSGSYTKTFTIIPKGTKVTSAKAGKKKMTVKWKKQKSETTGYLVQYSTNKKFSKGVKTLTVKKNKTTSAQIKKLKAKKNYYVRVCTYKNVKINGKTTKLSSSWSNVKSAKIKK